MPNGTPSSPLIHRTVQHSPNADPSKPWHTQLTLDLLIHVLDRTLFHPFIAALLPLCLRALAVPYDSPRFVATCVFATGVSLYWMLEGVNKRIAYGAPREVDWENELVVITGGIGGLGGCLAEIFALKGVGVAVLDVNLDGRGLRDREEKEGITYYRCDVGDHKQVEKVWQTVVSELGTPTILVNNAAVVGGKPFLEQNIEDVEITFRVNALSHYNLARLFLQEIHGRPSGGTLVTVSSVLACLGTSNLSAYTASKAALLAYHSSLSAELATKVPQIKTVLVKPGQLDTQLFENIKVRGWLRNFFGPVVGAGEVAVKIAELIDRGEGGVVSLPAYARWIAWLEILPVGLQRVIRDWTGIDAAFAMAGRSSHEALGEYATNEERGKE